MNEIAKALEALDRIFNYCEEIDLHLPKEEQTGYDMLVDINIIGETLVNQKSVIEELEKINEKIDFEEKWLFDVYAKEYKISAKDIEIAMSGIRRVVAEMKGENKCQNQTN